MARISNVVASAAVLLLGTSAVKVVKEYIQDSDVSLQIDPSNMVLEIDPCQCMNWKEVYASKFVSCHDPAGYEYYSEEMSRGWTAKRADDENEGGKCSIFLEKLDGSFCIRQQLGVANNDKTWCFVSSECPDADLNGGGYHAARSNSTDLIGRKFCTDADTKISDLLPEMTRAGYRNLTDEWGIDENNFGGGYMTLAVFTLTDSQFGDFFAKNCETSSADVFKNCQGHNHHGTG